MSPVLSERERSKRNADADECFYATSRFVTHAEDWFLRSVTDTDAPALADCHSVLDAMNSWVSHLPSYDYERVVGHGLNPFVGVLARGSG